MATRSPCDTTAAMGAHLVALMACSVMSVDARMSGEMRYVRNATTVAHLAPLAGARVLLTLLYCDCWE